MAASKPGFNLNTFDIYWSSLDSESRTELISRAGFFQPQMGILPILEGLGSFHFQVRTAARQSLDELCRGITEKLRFPTDSDEFSEGCQEAVQTGARIFHKITPDLAFADLSVLVISLLSLGEKGAFFAFKTLYQNRVSKDVMKKSIQAADEYQQLIFVDQYLQAPPGVRLKFAPLFKDILTNIKARKPVIEFFAGLFDRKRDPDPFLNNINPVLRDPARIMEAEIVSQSPTSKILGLKALSMIQSRIPDDVLLNTLTNEEVKKVRLGVYSLVENSSMGLYPELFDAIFTCFLNADLSEAVSAFKALVVTGKISVHDLFTKIRAEYPEALPNIFLEISSLSRISFFVIQDIALNKELYLDENLDVNLACIFGMIKKRPERVVQVLKVWEESSGEKLSIDLGAFITKASQLLKKEKQNIEAPFKVLEKKLDKEVPEKPKGFFQSVLKDPIEKKLDTLMVNRSGNALDLSGLHLREKDFSDKTFTANQVFFNKTILQSCDLSGVRVAKACFSSTVFYDVNMTGARFERINFDNAVFVNVDARQAVFDRCSFQGASFFSCNFNDSDLSDGIFIDANISKTAFARTNMACACFSGARISGITFATANMNLADFSGVKARFTRFPSHVVALVRNDNIDYNARVYQIGFKDLPRIEASVVKEINMLIFCEFIHYGEGKFLNQNKLSLLTAFDVFRPTQADFFQLLPLLIHENILWSELGHIAMSTPCGISDYLPSRETIAIAEQYMGKKDLQARHHPSPHIQGVFSMGSVGSLAQTSESDIDYWICIDEQVMDKEGLGLLRRKLDAIEKLAWDKYKIRVTFFLVDILKARNNDFGGSTQESSGSAQSRLLKEEFYRTMIHVAGKLPLWSVLPTTISINYYNLILDKITKITQSHRYIDLGDIHAIPVNEFFGASIWQMFKWLKSPFKSVIKMALLEKYIQAYGQEILLCNQYKNEWMNSGTHLKPGQNDSYIILLNTLIAFYRSSGDQKAVNLLLTCFFLKLGIAKPAEVENTVFGMRRILLEDSLKEWGWAFKKIFEIGRFKIWPYAAIQRLSLTIERYMVSKYMDLKKRFDTHSVSGLMISEADRIVLERKVNVVFQNKPNKIKQLLLVSRGDRHFSKLHIKYLPGIGKSGQWELVHKIPKHKKLTEESIITAGTIEEIGAWMINNRLYTDHTFMGLVPNATSVSHENIDKLFHTMHDFFMPEMKKTIHFKVLREQPKITRLFISMNFYARKQQTRITDYTVVYLNSWGEMYLRSSKPGMDIANAATAQKGIMRGLSLKHFPRQTILYAAGAVKRL